MNLIKIRKPDYEFDVIRTEKNTFIFRHTVDGEAVNKEAEKEHSDTSETCIHIPIEDFLNIDAKQFPGNMLLMFVFESSIADLYYDYFSIHGKGRTVELGFSLKFTDEQKAEMKYNPFLILYTTAKHCEQASLMLETDIEEIVEESYASVHITIERKGNLLRQYKRGLKIIEVAYKNAMEEIRSMKD